MKVAITKLIMISTTLFCSSAMAYDFKGIEVGSKTTREDILEKIGAECLTEKTEYICSGPTTIIGSPAFALVIMSFDFTVRSINITFSSDTFDSTYKGIFSKYGKPTTSSKKTLQNGFGAKFLRITYLWKNKDSVLTLDQNYKANESQLSIYTKEYIEFINKSLESKSKDL